MSFETLISCADLYSNLHKQDWVIVDCRFDLAQPDWGFSEYQVLHIPGTVYASLDTDLAAPITSVSGRHPLPEPAAFLSAMSRLGIDETTQVIVYDATSNSFAARLWFLLKLYGHANVAVLDGGFGEWLKLGLPSVSGIENNTPKSFHGTPQMEKVMTTRDVEAVYTQPDWLLIDARAPERFSGKQETIDFKAGHIPGAINRFYGLNLDSTGRFLPAEDLRKQFESLMQGYRPENVVVYCGSGVTSIHHLIAMSIAGLPLPRLYAGSWSEWIRNPDHPIVQKETSW
jgi:thiosulfate/3-mercaptopyruvate sulfurtransferase